MQDPGYAEFMTVMAPGHSYIGERRGLAERPIKFNDPTDFFNEEPPSAMVTFIIGGVLWVIAFGMFLHRVHKLKKRSPEKLQGFDLYRGLIACLIDNDSPYYTITSFSAISFLFLGGIQTDFQTTLIFMICYYAVVSFGDSLRVLMAYWSYGSLSEVFLFTEMDAGLKNKQAEDEKEKDMKFETMEVQPNNIYEDMGREKTIVIMIFITQMVLVSFVCIDIYRAETVRCMDGTPDCPVAGTAGSYGFYIMGIFQACVYLLGPKTSFGQSEQNPGFWLILLLASKKNGARILWENPVKDPRKYPKDSTRKGTLHDPNGNMILDANGDPKWFHQRILDPYNYTMWRRFFMSYLVNGVCFHILVHALPIQVASQSSFTGVVFRAVGMLYLVDLDDSKGFRLIITNKHSAEEKAEEEAAAEAEEDKKNGEVPEVQEGATTGGDVEQVRPPGKMTNMKIDSTGAVTPILETAEDQQAAIEDEANEILAEAQTKLELLRQNGPSTSSGLGKESRLSSARMKKTSPCFHGGQYSVEYGIWLPGHLDGSENQYSRCESAQKEEYRTSGSLASQYRIARWRWNWWNWWN